MNRFKKISTLFLAILVFLTSATSVYAEEYDATVEIVLQSDYFEENDIVTAEVYVVSGKNFDTVGYSIRYDRDSCVLLRCEEARNMEIARTKRDANTGILARSLFVSAGKNVAAEDGRVLVDTITFKMLKDGSPDIGFELIENDADFGRGYAFVIFSGEYFKTSGAVAYESIFSEELEKLKTEAKEELSAYKDPVNYRDSEKEDILRAVSDGIREIDVATKPDAVKKALEEAKKVLDGIKTDQQLKAEEDAAHEHSYGAWKIVKDATCTEKGEEKRVCACGSEESRTTDASGHKEEILQAVSATCKTTGLTEGRKCTVCKTVTVVQEVTKKIAHTEEIIPGKPATETETGLTEGKKCSVCGEVLVKQEVIPAVNVKITPGDVDMNGFVDAKDATQILRYINAKTSVFTMDGADTVFIEKIADVTGDGAVDARDATQILRYINGKESALDK